MGPSGMIAMLKWLSGNKDTDKAIQAALTRVIESIVIDPDWAEIGGVVITFTDGAILSLCDDGQSCCESRYTRTDDDLPYYKGAVLNSIEVRDAPSVDSENCGEHDVQFLVVLTSKGNITFSNHVEHNGYYGGFAIKATFAEPTAQGD